MSLIDFVYPKNCLNCRRSGFYLCPKCVSDVGFASQKCIYCQKASIDGFVHSKCRRKYRIDGSVSVFRHEKVIREGIIKLKYKFIYEMARELSVYMAYYLRYNVSAVPKKAVLVPIPLHPKRYKWRGFNQSQKLGEVLAKHMGWGFAPHLLVRTKLTTPQVKLKGDERRKNLKGVFAINPSYNLPTKTYPLLLFDDVITTGATIIEAGKVLKRAGFKSVWGLSVAG
jgi:competence protein ComFC